MKNFALVLGVVATAMLSGCMTTPMPMNANEFRAVFENESQYTAKESYDVSVPLEKISRNFKKLAPKCFDVTVRATSSNASGINSNHYYHYKSTVLVKKSKAEIHVQSYHEGDEVFLTMPKDGIYTVVADATKVGSNTTHIDLYYSTFNGTPIAKAIKGWTYNKNLGCPELTK